MNYTQPSKCSVCGGELLVTRLSCSNCGSEVGGAFAPSKYLLLSDKQKLFLETFLKCRGSIKDVEKSLSISYPTVKGLLDELLEALFPTEQPQGENALTSAEILDMLENGDITAAEAAQMLSDRKG